MPEYEAHDSAQQVNIGGDNNAPIYIFNRGSAAADRWRIFDAARPGRVVEIRMPQGFNYEEQAVFEPIAFGDAMLNLHRHSGDSRTAAVVLFVSSPTEQGYTRWGRFPEFIYDYPGRSTDVAIYDYFSGNQNRRTSGVSIKMLARTLGEQIQGLAQLYDEIYLAAHSVGGLIAMDALRQYVRQFNISVGIIPAAGLFLFDSLLEFPAWFDTDLHPQSAEAETLGYNSDYHRALENYFNEHVNIQDSTDFGHKDYCIPIYSAYIRLGDTISPPVATPEIPEHQRIKIPDHVEMTSPTSPDGEQVLFVLSAMNTISMNRATQRASRTRRNRHRSPVRMPAMMPSNLIVTEIFIEADAVDWKFLWDDVLKSISNSHKEVQVVDTTSMDDDWPPDLLIAIHNSDHITSGAATCLGAIHRVRDRYNELKIETRIFAAGSQSDQAREIILREWGLHESGSRPDGRLILVDVAQDDADLRGRLQRHLEGFVANRERTLDKPKDTI